jgi:hypothetical protein
MTPLHLFFLARFSVLGATLLVAFPFVAVGPAQALLGNLFDLHPVGAVWTGLLATFAGWAVGTTVQLHYRYSASRHGLERWRLALPLEDRLKRSRFWLALGLAFPTLGVAWSRSSVSPLLVALGLAAGVTLAFGLLRLAALAEQVLVAAEPGPRAVSELLPKVAPRLATQPPAPPRLRPFEQVFARLLGTTQTTLERVLKRWSWLRQGYLDDDGRLLPGHLLGLSLLVLFSLLYGLIGLLGYPGWGLRGPSEAGTVVFAYLPDPGTTWLPVASEWFPALGYLLILIIVFILTLPALAFLLDRYQVPTTLLLVALPTALIFGAKSDHYFPVSYLPGQISPPPCALEGACADADRLPSLLFDREGPAVVAVAAAGGGITAAAWTTEVLSRLAEDPEIGAPFLSSLALVSGVSGGSVGSLFFVDRLPASSAAPLDPALGREMRQAASASSLEAVAWGIAYPDLLRGPFAPVFATTRPWTDRNWALESSWARRLRRVEDGRNWTPTLGGWRQDTLAGTKPLVIFNATVVETGGYFQLETLNLPGRHRTTSFFSAYPRLDVPVVTAARLSATFPFVSAAARAKLVRTVGDEDLPAAHLVDGGYYENSGVLSALEVLEMTLERMQARNRCPDKPILLLRIQPFSTPQEEYARIRAAAPWTAATFAPLRAIIEMRTTSQLGRNALELEIFRKRWAHFAEIEVIDVPLGDLGPLSWKLTRAERCRIANEWQRLVHQEGGVIERLRTHLAPESLKASPTAPQGPPRGRTIKIDPVLDCDLEGSDAAPENLSP